MPSIFLNRETGVLKQNAIRYTASPITISFGECHANHGHVQMKMRLLLFHWQQLYWRPSLLLVCLGHVVNISCSIPACQFKQSRAMSLPPRKTKRYKKMCYTMGPFTTLKHWGLTETLNCRKIMLLPGWWCHCVSSFLAHCWWEQFLQQKVMDAVYNNSFL